MPSASKPVLAEECACTPGVLQRAFEVLCAAAGLILLSPLFCAIAVAIKCDDDGPVFYSQQRIGRNFRPFRLYKFRSMIVDADRQGLLTAFADPRITRIGRWLRKYKIDELPQLFNVLRGEMQLVGARPEVERYVQMFHAQYAVLLQDCPGITDPATLAYRHEEEILSVHCSRQQYVDGILPIKIKLSLEYQRRRTFASDVRILLQTVFGLIT
jgi:lipopolysaccharide/colanic/teichoic acid biosynthesis glycosyltransferase